MKKEVREALEKTVLESLDQIDTSVEIGSEEYERIMKQVNDACQILAEDNKNAEDFYVKDEERKAQVRNEKEQVRNERAKILVGALTEVTKTLVVVALVGGILKFEETGTLRSKAWTLGVSKLFKL